MTFVGKLLIVLQVFLSLCFLAFAGAVYTTQTNWKKNADDTDARATALQNTLDEVNAEFATHKRNADDDVKNANERADGFEVDFRNASDDLEATKNQLNDAITLKNAAVEESVIASNEAAQRLQEATGLRSELSKLREESDEQVTQIRQMEDDLLSIRGQLADATTINARLNDDLAAKIELLIQEDINPDSKPSGTALRPPPKDLNALVLASRRNKSGSTEYVAVSIGSDDGLVVGHELVVYRGGKYLGTIELVRVDADDSVGVVKKRARNGVIERGDNVTASL